MTKRGDSRDVLTFSVDGEECVPITQAAELRKVSRAAIWLACRDGRLPSRRVGSRLYVPLAAIQAWRPDRAALRRGRAAAAARAAP